MKSLNLSSYSPELLGEVLSVLRFYTAALKQIGARAELRDPKGPRSSNLKVEFSPGSDQSFVRDFTQKLITSFFSEMKSEECVYEENPHITGWIRMFFGDDMIDISFERFAHLIKNA
jgi:hypothetical protein